MLASMIGWINELVGMAGVVGGLVGVGLGSGVVLVAWHLSSRP